MDIAIVHEIRTAWRCETTYNELRAEARAELIDHLYAVEMQKRKVYPHDQYRCGWESRGQGDGAGPPDPYDDVMRELDKEMLNIAETHRRRGSELGYSEGGIEEEQSLGRKGMRLILNGRRRMADCETRNRDKRGNDAGSPPPDCAKKR